VSALPLPQTQYAPHPVSILSALVMFALMNDSCCRKVCQFHVCLPSQCAETLDFIFVTFSVFSVTLKTRRLVRVKVAKLLFHRVTCRVLQSDCSFFVSVAQSVARSVCVTVVVLKDTTNLFST
jgi:hypothetical protein